MYFEAAHVVLEEQSDRAVVGVFATPDHTWLDVPLAQWRVKQRPQDRPVLARTFEHVPMLVTHKPFVKTWKYM